MNVIAVDDEKIALQDILSILSKIALISNAIGFMLASEALQYAAQNTVDVAFLDINMRETDGLSLAKRLKEISPATKIVFVTGYSEYSVKAFKLRAHGYLMKPVTSEDVEEELNAVLEACMSIDSKEIYIQTFGNFEVFVGDEPIVFTRAKPKELLAYLVDRKGASISAAEIAAVLWEDKPYDRYLQNQTQKIISFMMATLKQYRIQDIILKKYNNISIDKSKVSCDYYSFLEGDINAINAYTGEYMANYSWGEFTASILNEKN